MTNLTHSIYGRLQFNRGDKIAGVFTITSEGTTYTIVAEFQRNKWVPFWSTDVEPTSENYSTLLDNIFTNLTNLFTDQTATSNVNEAVEQLTRRL